MFLSVLFVLEVRKLKASSGVFQHQETKVVVKF